MEMEISASISGMSTYLGRTSALLDGVKCDWYWGERSWVDKRNGLVPWLTIRNQISCCPHI